MGLESNLGVFQASLGHFYSHFQIEFWPMFSSVIKSETTTSSTWTHITSERTECSTLHSLASKDNRNHWALTLYRKYILDDFISIRKCEMCECYCPAAFIAPEKAIRIIQRSQIVKKGSEIDIYMKYLTTLDQDKIRAELRGKPKTEDVSNPKSGCKVLTSSRSSPLTT